MHYLLNLERFKIYVKIHTNIAPTYLYCFAVHFEDSLIIKNQQMQ
jgi:hypothetical protein